MATVFYLGYSLSPAVAYSKRSLHGTLFASAKKGMSRRRNEFHQDWQYKKKSRQVTSPASSQGLITIKKSDGDWADSWTDEYVISLKALGLMDLVSPTDGTDNDVTITLSIKKHATVGYSVDGKVVLSLTQECINCCAKYTTQVNAPFSAWCIPLNHSFGWFQEESKINDDPSIIYFTPGKDEAYLDDFIRDTLRLNCFTKGTCSDACDKSGLSQLDFGNPESTSVSIEWLPLMKADVN